MVGALTKVKTGCNASATTQWLFHVVEDVASEQCEHPYFTASAYKLYDDILSSRKWSPMHNDGRQLCHTGDLVNDSR